MDLSERVRVEEMNHYSFIFGTRQGYGEELDVDKLDGTNGFKITGIRDDACTGGVVSTAGDFNNDGIVDLSIAPGGTYHWSKFLIFRRKS